MAKKVKLISVLILLLFVISSCGQLTKTQQNSLPSSHEWEKVYSRYLNFHNISSNSKVYLKNQYDNIVEVNFYMTSNGISYNIIQVSEPSMKEDSENYSFNDVKSLLLENYKLLQGEPCGVVTEMFADKAKQRGIKYRTLQLFADPSQAYSTHVAAEVWLPELSKWVYIDPTFNGYYISNNTPLSTYELREKVKHNEIVDRLH